MSKIKLPGSGLLDRYIGQSSFKYVDTIKIPNFNTPLSHDHFKQIISEYKPPKLKYLWQYMTPFGMYFL